MNLATAVGNYITAWEGQSKLQRNALIDIKRLILSAPFDEVNTEYNTLCRQSLWNEALIDIFHDELLRRLHLEYTFAISIAWRTISEWQNSPFVHIRISFEETYPIIDMNQEYIPLEQSDIKNITITNNHFEERVQENIFRLIFDNNISAQIRINSNDTLDIVSLYNSQNPLEKITFLQVPQNSNLISAPVQVIEYDDFRMIKRMIISLRDRTYELIDPYEGMTKLTEADFKYQEAHILDADTT